MTTESQHLEARPPGAGQVVLPPAAPFLAPADQIRILSGLSDPALSELGLDELLDEVLERVQQALGVDTVAILLYDPDARRLVARAAKGIEEEVEQGVQLPLGKGFAGRIAAERVAIAIADVDHADILNPILREKGICSLLGLPLVVEGDLIGVLHVGSLVPRTFRERDLAVLQVAAARVAPGIERARLYSALEREHRVAVMLQRSLLPRDVAGVVGVGVAARYLPARDAVGGDWYDVIELPHGLVGIAIGDVVGHGIRAAALMGQVRFALHAYALEGHSPGRALELVDRYVQTMREHPMATAAYAVFDTETGGLRLATAGHVPPIIVGPTRAVVLDVQPGAPLGAFRYGSCPEHELTLASGEMILLYTDGLVERRGNSLTQGIEELLAVVRTGDTAEQACRNAMEALVPPEGLDDDVAMLVLHNLPVPADLRLYLPADPKALADVRQVVRRWLRERGAEGDDVNEITLAVGEACSNAIEHAYSPGPAWFEFEATESGGEVTIAVRDTGRWREARGDNRGRGLKIIDAAMSDVELTPTSNGTEIVMRRRLRTS
ncbi:MAG TPA: SpoIIE family protein phosphatase [Solirubrobacteraceae bacterium]|nr:SpoIIE family protein phosphatase [Solirubrobacteraceae bacterium]